MHSISKVGSISTFSQRST